MDRNKIGSFLARLDVELQKPVQDIHLKAESIQKQMIRLRLTITNSIRYKEYRLHVLSALYGEDVITQKQLNWHKTGALLTCLAELEDNGTKLLKGIEMEIISNPHTRPSELFFALRRGDDMPDLQTPDSGTGGLARGIDSEIGSDEVQGRFVQLDFPSM